jgi:hypothetical protein
MLLDPADDRAMRRAITPRGPWRHLLAELMAMAGGQAELLRHCERPWSSVTFSGARHEVTLQFNGTEAVAAAEHWIEALPEHEFTLPRCLVADAAVVRVDHAMHPVPQLRVEVELLVLDES